MSLVGGLPMEAEELAALLEDARRRWAPRPA
jgi:hypothetical protein